jgi:ABC-type amino acid transport system permease subunit
MDAGQTRTKGTVERVVEGLATGIGNTVGFAAGSGILFVVFGALWLAVGIGLIVSQGSVDAAWQAIRALPLVVQAVVWLLFLPVVAGLWVWETSWPVVVRLTLLIGIAGWNLLIFLPRALTTRP